MFDGPEEIAHSRSRSGANTDHGGPARHQWLTYKQATQLGAYKPLHAQSYFRLAGMVLVVIARFGLMPALARRDRDLELDAILNQESYQSDFSSADTNTSRAAVSRTGRTTSAEDRRARSDASLCAV